jgi:RimJ/RimL family protein N-acetyltransferase
MTEPVTFINGGTVVLRPAEPADAEWVYFGKNHPQVRDALFLYFPLTLDQIRNEQQSWSENRETILFTICVKETNLPVGQTALVRWDAVSRAAVFYLAIYKPDQWSKGYGGETVELMCRYAFAELNLNRIQLHVSSENPAAIRAYQKAGFRVEGTLRQAMYHNGRYVDFLVMGLLRQEYHSAEETER